MGMKNYDVLDIDTEELVPEIKDEVELEQHLQPLYVIADYMDSKEHYIKFKDDIYRTMKGCYEKESCRHHPIRFKFYVNDEKTFELPFNNFITLSILLYPIVFLSDIRDVMDESFIPNFPDDITNIDDYINYKLIDTLRDNDVPSTVMNDSISNVIYDLRQISPDFAEIMGVNFSLEMFIELYNNYKEVRDIMETSPEGLSQSKDIEELADRKQKELVRAVSAIPKRKTKKGYYIYNNLGMVLRAKTGIKIKQLGEYTIFQGLKPDIEGRVIQYPITTSTLIGGLRKPGDQFIDSGAGRKSLIMNKIVMGRAGHFGKSVLLLCNTLSLSKTVLDCGTKHLVPYQIRDKEILWKLNNRYYRLTDNAAEPLKLLNAGRDKHLIGKTIYVRSVATCALGDSVCHICAGRTALLNMDIADGFFGFACQEVTKDINQRILSAKHLLTTRSREIKFTGPFDKYMSLQLGEIYPRITDSEVENLNDYAIYINRADLEKVDEMDSDNGFNTFINGGKFYILNLRTGEMEEITPEEETDMYISVQALDLMKKGKGYIRFADMEADTQLFSIDVINNELTKPLYAFINTTNKKASSGEETIASMCQKLLELTVSSGIGASAVATEGIVNRLIRAVDENGNMTFERPDFTAWKMPAYTIGTVKSCLEHNSSPFVGLAFENLKRQILSDEFEEKHGTSYLDPLFSTEVWYRADGKYRR